MSRVLVVDDDEDIRDLIAFRLSADGYDVSAHGNPVAALEVATAATFDLAVLDWSMPAMDGGELCARLRELPGVGDAPILVVTAHADPDTRSQAYAAGATEYIAKPFTLKQLSDVVRELFAQGVVTTGADRPEATSEVGETPRGATPGT